MRRGRIMIFLILIVVIGLALLYFAYAQFGGPTVQPTQTALTEIYYVAENIPQGTVITEAMLATFSIPPENVAEVMFTVGEGSAVVGHAARYALEQGVILTSAMIEPALSTITDPSLEGSFAQVDQQYQQYVKGNIAYTAPKSMKVDEQVTIDLVLNPTASPQALATQAVTLSGLPTSTAQASTLITEEGSAVGIITDRIEVTDRMKAVLKSADSDALTVQPLHDNDIQLISSTQTTRWHWVISAKKEGTTKLTLSIYRLIQYKGGDYWHEVDSYNSTINVRVTPAQRIKKEIQGLNLLGIIGWILSTLTTAILIPLYLERRKGKKQKVKLATSGKYAPLKEYLHQKSRNTSEIQLTFDEMETIISDRLPRSANKIAWWISEASDAQPQARSWLDAGWKVEDADVLKEKVTFKKV